MILTGAEIVVETLIEQGTDVVFGYPGGQVIDLYDALYTRSDRIHHVLTAHEQGASHAADGYARISGKVGVVIATSGPGATNLVTGIATAYLDSIPMVAITGNVPNSLIGRDSFQEVDITGITLPVTKHNFFVKSVDQLADTIREAFAIAKSGRPGPVLVDVPKDVQKAAFAFAAQEPAAKMPQRIAKDDKLQKAAEMIAASEKPYIYIGGGVITAGVSEEIIRLADTIDAPIGCTMMGLSAVPDENPRFLGMEGMHGHYASSVGQDEADLIITIGARFSDRATGNVAKYARRAKILHIDADGAELNKNVTAHMSIECDIQDALHRLLAIVKEQQHPEWMARIAVLRAEEQKQFEDITPVEKLTPYALIHEVSKHTTPETPVATDVGQHQMWTAQYYPFRKPRTFASSGGLGTMGYGLGAAIGAAYASGKKTVLFTGDGSFGMNLNELATLSANNIPVVIILMNNGVLGMVRQWQTLFFDRHYSNTMLTDRKTDFVKLAAAFGIAGYRISEYSELESVMEKAFAEDGPVLVECMIDKDEFVLPMLPPGGCIEDIIVKVEGE
ncbi:MAG: biosynthetic-type acetolactate synthase large subunit [Ruminococcus sp.]|nr:biosynthetic-type acetolactate synthase large subunit [Ruminococcus sp.]